MSLAFAFIVIFPIMMLGMSVALWIPEDKPLTLSVGFVNLDSTAGKYGFNTTVIVRIFNETKVNETNLFSIREFKSKEEALEVVRKGDIDAVIVFPDGFSKNLTSGFTSNVEVYIAAGDVQRKEIVRGVVTSFLGEISKKVGEYRVKETLKYVSKEDEPYIRGLALPMNITVEEVAPETLIDRRGIIGWTTIGMVGVQILFSGVIGSAESITGERQRKTLKRIIASPVSEWELLIGKTLAILVELAISALICIAFGVGVLGGKILWNPRNPAHWLVLPLFLLGVISMIGLGLIISTIAKTSKGASGLATAICWPLMFLTGIVVPKWILPEPLQVLADVFPLSRAIEAVREIIIYGKPASVAIKVMPQLALVSLAVYAVGAIICRKLLRGAWVVS